LVIAFALAAALMARDTNMVLSPRVRAMLEHFPPPHAGLPSITIRFSRDTVWLGEQVELVTATWFPRTLREQLRRAPGISSPSLTGLWSARNQQLPIVAGTRIVGNQAYDLYISWQTIFPLGSGRINAPPAVLTYNLPTSTAYFAPEVAKSFRSDSASLTVRPIPAALTASLGPGPTGRNVQINWRGPVTTVQAGAPAIVELVVSGEGNLTLWPEPRVDWPAGVHVYPEPTQEHPVTNAGLISGEKHFRYTVVADSAGVLTLPPVSYPFFDPGAVQVSRAAAKALTLPVLQRPVSLSDRRSMPVSGSADVPIVTLIVRDGWPVWLLIALLPPLVMLRRPRSRVVRNQTPATGDPEAALRRALGTPVEAGEGHVVAALRARGVPRDEAEHILRWLAAVGRRRYGPAKSDIPEAPAVVARVLARLRGPTVIVVLLLAVPALRAQQDDAVGRFNGGDFPGAARAFGAQVAAHPLAAGSWRDLGTARWMARDDVGATAAWLRALALAPRDPLLRDAWGSAATIPPDIRSRAPAIPLNRDELLLIALAAWLATWALAARRREALAWSTGLLCAATMVVVIGRWRMERPGQLLVNAATAMRISPTPATAMVGELPAWSLVKVERRLDQWLLVGGQTSGAGSISALSVKGWIPATAVVPIGPLD
jgi:hypothetical protein